MGVVPFAREPSSAVASTIASKSSRSYSGARRLKRGLDVTGALLVCVCLAPFLMLIAAGVRWSSPGPVLHRRRVVGLGGRTFDAFKFRSMRVDADRAIEVDASMWAAYVVNFKLPDDPRVTPLGRWLRRYSIDELPQLFNVVRGEMAVVGPRMITEPELKKYGDHAGRLLSVRPGLTGLWQVSGRQTTTYERRVELDLFYIDHWSLWLDLRILCKTPRVVIRGEGAY